MHALWLENQQLSYRQDLDPPTPPEGEALVRVRLAGVCATDLELMRGYYPFTGILGHEFVGELVHASGSLPAGQRVVGEINAACGECRACQAGRPTHCERRNVLGILGRNGAFADYLTLPLENLHPVPAEVPNEAAVFTEPLAAALEIQEQVQIKPSDQVLVIGAGRLGQLIVQTLALTGCGLQVVARHDSQRRLLQQIHVQAIREQDVPHNCVDIVVEATGTPGGFQLARQAIRARGVLVLKSTYAGDVQLNLSSIVVDEITLVGSRCGPFPPALRLLASGLVDPTPLIQERFRLEDGIRALDRAAQRGVLKVLLEP